MGPKAADFLFAEPSFLSGVARTVDMFGTFDRYNRSATPERADALALFNDWCVVGAELVGATKRSLRNSDDETSAPRQQELFEQAAGR